MVLHFFNTYYISGTYQDFTLYNKLITTTL